MKGADVVDVRLLLSTRSSLLQAGFLLLGLAIFDSISTDYGIRHNYIEEANPIMGFVYEASILGFYAIKVSLPFLLLYVLTKIEPKLYLRLLMGFSLFLYVIVLFQHIFWISLVL